MVRQVAADDDPNRVVPTYAIITTTATDGIGRIHDRVPMAITPDHWAEWLDPRNHDVDQLCGVMVPPVDGDQWGGRSSGDVCFIQPASFRPAIGASGRPCGAEPPT
ncbi:SOS response-associated peptidase family protein [Kribbella sp. NBC_00709]|uniref:SOS response-associated peptidase family protein n=1 Tax=Kribbella sp. NBC_00709 TaxID=2975972 RepID=UPI003FA589E5